MATLYHEDGSIKGVFPKAKNKWSLGELQELVGGYIEMMPGVKIQMLFDEQAKIKNRKINTKATELVHEQLAKQLKIKKEFLYTEIGRRLRYLPIIYGSVLVLDQGEKF